MKKNITFKIGKESLPTVLSMEEYSESPFSYAIEKGKKKLLEILSAKAMPLESSPNNIISFLGDRGTGKTSCLLSLRNICIEDKDDCVFSRTEFMPIIDPSFFDDNHNILEIFVGELYREYIGMIDKWRNKSNSEREVLRELQSNFTNIRRALKFIAMKQEYNPLEEHEELEGLSEGLNLSNLLSKLIECYLQCKDKDFLVISIDDIDLNVRNAYVMMEQIRKYLVLPKVAIMMAAKFDQLMQCIRIDLKNCYKQVINDGVTNSDVQEMAERYLDKFLPLDQRIFMPKTEDYSSCRLYIDTYDISGKRISHDDFETIEFAVLSLIFKKCGHLFYNYEDEPSLIIPRNLRELRSLVTMLYALEDRSLDHEIHEINKSRFKDYLYEQWIKTLPTELLSFAKRLLSEHNLITINKSVVRFLYESFLQDKFNISESDWIDDVSKLEDTDRKIIREILSSANLLVNVSIGDVMFIINKIKDVAFDIDTKRFLFFLQAYYSIILYELYDDMTMCQNETEGNDAEKENQDSNLPKLKSSKDYNVYDYFKIVGNNFFVLNGDTFLPLSQTKGQSRELTMIDGRCLRSEITRIKSDFEKDEKVVNDKSFCLRLNIVEFFILTTSRRILTKNASYSVSNNDSWRTDSSIYYFSPISAGVKNILFDITAPFVNMIYPKYAYDRFDVDLYDIADKCNGSLLYKILNAEENKRYSSGNKSADLMSRMAIRNIEILNDLHKWLQERKENSRPVQNGDIGILRDFYTLFKTDKRTGYSIKTYNLNDSENSNITIDFQTLGIFADFLTELMDYNSGLGKSKKKGDVEFKEIFDRIFRPQNKMIHGMGYDLEEVLELLGKNGVKEKETGETVIRSVIDNREIIDSETLVKRLADIEVLSNATFADILDDQLRTIYKRLARQNTYNDLKRLEDMMSDLESVIEENEIYIKSTQSNIDVIDKRMAALMENMASLDSIKANLKKEIAELETRADAMKGMVIESTKELENNSISVSQLEAEFKGMLEVLQSKQQRLEDLKGKKKSVINAHELKNLTDEISSLESENEALTQNLKKVETEHKEALDRREQLARNHQELNLRNSQLNEKILNMNNELSEQAQKRGKLESENAYLNIELENNNKQLNDYNRTIQKLGKERTEIRSEFMTKKRRYSRILSTL